MSKRKIVIHVGTEKTGSTYLQEILCKNKSLIKTQGVCFPDAGLESGHHYWIAKALGFKFKISPINTEKEGEALNKLKETISDWNGDILLSSEHFDIGPSEENTQELKKLFPDEDLTIILILRNQLDYSQSLYAEGLKWGMLLTYDDFLKVSNERNRYNYLRRLQLWQDIGANVRIIDYDLCRHNLLSAFIDASNLDIKPDSLVIPNNNTNVTASIDFLEMIRVCNLSIPPEDRRAFYEKCVTLLGKGASDLLKRRKFKIPNQADIIFQNAEIQNLELADKLGLDRSNFMGGDLMKYLDKYKSYGAPDPISAMKLFIPHLCATH